MNYYKAPVPIYKALERLWNFVGLMRKKKRSFPRKTDDLRKYQSKTIFIMSQIIFTIDCFFLLQIVVCLQDFELARTISRSDTYRELGIFSDFLLF